MQPKVTKVSKSFGAERSLAPAKSGAPTKPNTSTSASGGRSFWSEYQNAIWIVIGLLGVVAVSIYFRPAGLMALSPHPDVPRAWHATLDSNAVLLYSDTRFDGNAPPT